MKSFSNYLLILTFSMLLFACKQNNNGDILRNDIDTEQFEKHTIIDVVPPFHKCDAMSLYVLVDLSKCEDETLWNCGVEEAILAYNNLPDIVGINMIMITSYDELPDGEKVNIKIDCKEMGLIAETDRRYDQNKISKIHLNSGIENNWPCPEDETASCCQLQRSVMHELAHALSFGHMGGATGSDHSYLNGTVVEDVNSILMITEEVGGFLGYCKDGFCSFTESDIHAFSLVYPKIDTCDCLHLFEPCACERNISIEMPSIWEENNCVPKNTNTMVCAYNWFNGPDVDYNWTVQGDITIQSNAINRQCITINVGETGGTISVFTESEECGMNSIFLDIKVCHDDGPTSPDGIIEK